MAKTICKILGVVFLLVGIAGFLNHRLLGMHLSNIHNVIHLVSAALALYFGFAATPDAARTFSLVFGIVYLGLGILGFIAPGVVSSLLMGTDMPRGGGMTSGMGAGTGLAPDNVVHLLLGAIFLVGGLARSARRLATT